MLLNSSFQINMPHGVARHLGVNPGDYIEFRVIETRHPANIQAIIEQAPVNASHRPAR